MIYYKLTCIKDMPECEKDFSYTIRGDAFDKNYYYGDINDKVKTLIKYADSDFVRKDVDYDKADRNFVCPTCKLKSLFPYEREEEPTSDDGVTYFWRTIGMECGNCEKKYDISKIHTNTKIFY